MTILELAQSRIPDLKKKTANEWAGPCPECGGKDRFLVWTHRDAWHCRGCNQTGDAIEFLRKFEGQSCPDAHETLGLSCNKSTCPAWDKCRLGARTNGIGSRAPRQTAPLAVPLPEEDRQFVPDAATSPEQRWQQQAAKLIEKAHAKLLENPEQLAYLDHRGLPLDAVKQYQLGWLPENRYPSRAAWGLPEKLREDKKPKKMFVPAGILIPFFDIDNNPHRIRIRRSEVRATDGRYYWLDGSGNDVPVIGTEARAFVVVESDLDALMIHHHAGDIVGTIPLGSCSPKPKQWAMSTLEEALAILVALDFEPRINPKTGKDENPGGQSSQWWLQQFPRAQRWPVPAGKDPGEYYQDHSGDIRAWIMAGLPPAFHVAKASSETVPEFAAPEPPAIPGHAKGTTINGHAYVVAYHVADVGKLIAHYPDAVVFSPAEIEQLKGMSQEDAEKMLLAKKIFATDNMLTKPVDPAYQPPLPPEPVQEGLDL